jgi:hypothetical protein
MHACMHAEWRTKMAASVCKQRISHLYLVIVIVLVAKSEALYYSLIGMVHIVLVLLLELLTMECVELVWHTKPILQVAILLALIEYLPYIYDKACLII